jgi:uncharacterized protein (DUF433 family)
LLDDLKFSPRRTETFDESPERRAKATGRRKFIVGRVANPCYNVKTPGVCSGQPRIAGTRIKVKHVYTWVERMGMTPTQVVAEYPQLTMAQVHAALAYYWSHQDEIHERGVIEAEFQGGAEGPGIGGIFLLAEDCADLVEVQAVKVAEGEDLAVEGVELLERRSQSDQKFVISE